MRVTVYVSSRIIVRRTLYDLYIVYLLPDVMVKFTRRVTGHFVTLIETGMYLNRCISVSARMGRRETLGMRLYSSRNFAVVRNSC